MNLRGSSLYGLEAVNQSCRASPASPASCWPHLSKEGVNLDKKNEEVNEFDYIIQRGRQLLPTNNNENSLLIDEINRAVASTATVTYIAFPSKGVPFSVRESLLGK